MKEIRFAFFAIFLVLGADYLRADDAPQVGYEQRQVPNKKYSLFRIRVQLNQGVPFDQITNPKNYALYPKNDASKVVAISSAEKVGSAQSGVYNLALLNLPPEFDPKATDYSLDVSLDGQSYKQLSVTAWGVKPNPADESKTQWELVSGVVGRYVSLTITPFVPLDSTAAPALDFHLKIPKDGDALKYGGISATEAWDFNANLTFEGRIKWKYSDTNVADHLNLAANLEYSKTYLVPDPIKIQDRAYFYGLRLKPAEMESDQKFRVVNYTLKPQIGFAVPYTDIPGWWWIHQTKTFGKQAAPLTCYAGYTHVVDLQNNTTSDAQSKLQKSDREEFELTYALPVLQQVSFWFRGRFFYLNSVSEFRDYESYSFEWELPKFDNLSAVFEYSNGSLPPKFERGHTFSIGIRTSF